MSHNESNTYYAHDKKVKFIDLGLVDYKEAWITRKSFFREVINKK